MDENLPKPKKSLKSFILDEDAKVMNKTTTKIALITSFLAINFLLSTHNVNAHGHHHDHNEHNNNIYKAGTTGTKSGSANVHESSDLLNKLNVSEPMKIKHSPLPPKSISSVHGNHFNHSDGKSSGFSDVVKEVV